MANIKQSFSEIQALSQLHQIIDDQQLRITKEQDFTKQCIATERFLGDHDIALWAKRSQRVNIMSGILASPWLLFFLFLFLYRKYIDRSVGLDYVLHLVTEFYPIAILAVLSVLGSIVYIVRYYALRDQLRHTLYPALLAKLGNKIGHE